MVRNLLVSVAPALILAAALSAAAQEKAENPGRDDLDQATTLQLTARSLDDFDRIATLCEGALKKGLSQDDQAFAKKLIGSAMFQRAEALSRGVLSNPPNARWQLMRHVAMQSLDRGLKHDPDLADGQKLVVQLNLMPGGDRKRALQAADELVRIHAADKGPLAESLVLRAALHEEAEKQLADLKQASELAPNNAAVYQALAEHYYSRDQFDEAAATFRKLIEFAPDNINARLALAETLAKMKKPEEAAAAIEEVIKQNPKAADAFVLRAQMHITNDRLAESLPDLDQALKLEPDNFRTRLFRAEVLLVQKNLVKARADVDYVLDRRPNMIAGVLMRARIRAAGEDYSGAVRDMELLINNTEEPPSEWKLQLAAIYSQDKQPRRAIELISEVLNSAESDEDQFDALRARGDALLSIGDHKQAIADYERALKISPQESGLLNNLAWTLATSPDDDLRNGERALKLALEACEETKYKQSHILSTLASAYAETGDFESAVKWSTKAVELSGDEIKEQLKQELESYQQKKPWRERQEVKEKPAPANLLET